MSIELKYVPHPKQQRFHDACKENKFILFLSGIACGKTLAGVNQCIYSALENPGYDGAIVSPTFSMLRDVIMPQWREYIPKQLYEERRKEQQLILWTGQTIFLRSAERPDTSRGLNLAWVWLDEPAMMRSSEMDDIICGRVGRSKGIPHPHIFYTTTPKGWNWLAQKFLREQKKNHRVIRAATWDSPYVPEQFVEDLREKYTEDMFKQEVGAEVIQTTGLCWPINYKVHCAWNRDDLFRSGNVIEVVAGVDWGWNNPSAIIVGAKVKGGRWYIIDEKVERPNEAKEVFRWMQELQRKWSIRRFWADSSEPERIREANALGLKTYPVKKRAGSVNQGVQEVASLIPIKKDGKPDIHFHHSCKKLLTEASYYHYVEGKENPVGDQRDDACDALRYMIYMENYSIGIRGYV